MALGQLLAIPCSQHPQNHLMWAGQKWWTHTTLCVQAQYAQMWLVLLHQYAHLRWHIWRQLKLSALFLVDLELPSWTLVGWCEQAADHLDGSCKGINWSMKRWSEMEKIHTAQWQESFAKANAESWPPLGLLGDQLQPFASPRTLGELHNLCCHWHSSQEEFFV